MRHVAFCFLQTTCSSRATLGIVCPTTPSHLYTAGSLGSVLVGRGHRVVLFGTPDGEPLARAAGVEFHAYGRREFSPEANAERLACMAGRVSCPSMNCASSDIPLKTGISGLGWPAVPNAATALAWAMHKQLDESQWWPAEALRGRQLEQLRRLLAHARETVPFYRKRDGRSDPFKSESTTWDQWRQMPIVERTDVQGAGDALNSTRVPPDHGAARLKMTTGSTGRPVRVLITQAAQLFWQAFTFREHLWHRRDFGAKLAAIRALDDGVALAPLVPAARTMGEWTDELRGHAATRRERPGTDLLSTLVAARDTDGALDEDELMAMLTLLLFAAQETTSDLIGTGVLALLRHPDQLRLLERNPALITGAVDEMLRFDPPT